MDRNKAKYAIVADPHACYDELKELWEEVFIKYGPLRKWIIAGDLLDKGPKPKEICEFAKQKNMIIVLGNHEEINIRYDRHEKERKKSGTPNPMSYQEDLNFTRQELLQLDWNPWKWLNSFSYYYYLPEYDVCVIHGGLEKGKLPEEMHYKSICRVRKLKKTGKLASLREQTEDMPFWTDEYHGDTIMVYGHAPALETIRTKNTVGLDTGCVYGNKLSCLLWPENEIVSTKSKKEYIKINFPWREL